MSFASIILATINARYTHAALGLRYLMANLEDLMNVSVIREFQIDQPPLQIAEALLDGNPRIIGLGVYIWNPSLTGKVVQVIKALRPQTAIILGGPEISHEYEGTELFRQADYLICGEGDEAFAALARQLLNGCPPAQKVIPAHPPELNNLALPYDLYTEEDLHHRRIYVETSRGCPFVCDFCLSALDQGVRELPLEKILPALNGLIARGARQFKFVDRSFNLNQKRAVKILDFFLQRWREGMQLHFEIVPDCLGQPLLQTMSRFPAEGLHLETGIQTFNPDVQTTVSRRQNMARTCDNMRFLREKTGAWIHADLMIGLPGESWESFTEGFNRLLALRPQQIQVGVLKRLKGTSIVRHAAPFGLVFAAHPPYEILQTNKIDFARMQRLKRFARYFDLYYNGGEFRQTMEKLWPLRNSPFESFMALSDAIWTRTGKTHELSLIRQVQYLYEFVAAEGHGDKHVIAHAVQEDFYRTRGRKEKLDFLNH